MFDSIISLAKDKLNLGDKAGSVVSSLLGLIANPSSGGFGGFIGKFRDAGLGEQVDSWIGDGENLPLDEAQVESALGAETIDTIASQTGIDRGAAASALATLTPGVVESLTPGGEVPDEQGLLGKVSGFITEHGGALAAALLGGLGAAGALASGAAGKIGDAAGAVGDVAGAGVDAAKAAAGKGAEVVGDVAGAGVDAAKAVAGKGAEVVGDVAGAGLDAGKAAFGAAGDAIGKIGGALDGDGEGGGGILRWLLPLILLGILVAVGFWFCSSKSTQVAMPNANKPAVNSNANTAAKAVESSFKIEAKDGKYVVTGVVPDQKTLDELKAKLEGQFGAGNVDVSGLKIDASAKPFAAGWLDNLGKLLPTLKDWKNGSLAFAGSAITAAEGLPAAALDALKSLFGGWTLPASLGAATHSLTELSLPNGTKLQAYPGGIEDQLVKFIGSDEFKNGTAESLKNKWFSFDDLNFKFGTTELAPESKRQLDNIVAILKAYPDLKIKIGGYTDKKGDDAANKKLSDDRAKAVKGALEKAGVGAQVPEAEGYGEEFATVAETASDDERKADRKTAVRLLK